MIASLHNPPVAALYTETTQLLLAQHRRQQSEALSAAVVKMVWPPGTMPEPWKDRDAPQASTIWVATATAEVVVVVVTLVVVWTKVVSTSTTAAVVTLVAVSVEAVVVDAAVDVAVPVTVVAGAMTPRSEQTDETLAGARRRRRGVDSLGQAVCRAPRRSTAKLVNIIANLVVVDVDTVVDVSVATSLMVVTVVVVEIVVSVAVAVAVSVTVTDSTWVVVTSVVWPTVTGDRKPLQKALASAARSSTQAGGSLLLAHRPRRRLTAPVWHVASHVGAVPVADVSPARATAAARRAPRSILRTRERPGL